MRIGAGIFLVAAGAIIAFAVRDTSGPIDFTVVGVVIMLAGLAGMWLSYRVANRNHPEHDDTAIIKPRVEEQYSTEPHAYPLDHEIDVTPSEYKDHPSEHR
jgi:membrane protein DedA with SNARE-associated domain